MKWEQCITEIGSYSYTKISGAELSLDKTLDCGQAFRWKKSNKGFWYGVVGNKIITLAQKEINTNKNRENEVDYCLITNQQTEHDLAELESYIDLDSSYESKIESLNLKEVDPYAYKCYEIGKGIHILRQDLYEMMITFMLSQCNTMHNIRASLEKLATMYGTKITTEWLGNKLEDYTIPTLEQLRNVDISGYKECSMGFRSESMYSMIQYLCKYPETLQNIKSNPLKATGILKQFRGIGDKVANCISLFSLHNIDAFPIDVHIKHIIDREYNGTIDISVYQGIAGIIQQYMYYTEAFINKRKA